MEEASQEEAAGCGLPPRHSHKLMMSSDDDEEAD